MSTEDVRSLEGQLEDALVVENSAAEILVLNGLRVRVMVPRPIGTPQDLVKGHQSSSSIIFRSIILRERPDFTLSLGIEFILHLDGFACHDTLPPMIEMVKAMMPMDADVVDNV